MKRPCRACATRRDWPSTCGSSSNTTTRRLPRPSGSRPRTRRGWPSRGRSSGWPRRWAMTPDNQLLELAQAVSDGTPVDWETAERDARSPDERGVIRRMRLVAEIAGFRSPSETTFSMAPMPRPASRAGDNREADETLVLRTWGHLQLVRLAGTGGFAEVFLARDMNLERDVALKLIRIDRTLPSGDAARTAERIIHEGRLLTRVRHQNVVNVLGADRFEGRPGIWMEFVRGSTLEHLLAERGPFSSSEAALIGLDLSRALAAMHAKNLLHRDVKTRNVMREEGGRIVLMDFGLGLETPGGDASADGLCGTLSYIAPELFENKPATARSDLYSLGVLLFHLVTGRYPVEARSADEFFRKHAAGERTLLRDLRPELPEAFVSAVENLIARDPGSRFASAGDAGSALARAAGLAADLPLDPVPAPEPIAPDPPRRAWWSPVMRRAAVAAAAALVVVGLGRTIPPIVNPQYSVEASLFRRSPEATERLVPGERVAPGDELFMEIKGSRRLYAYVINEDDQGKAFLLFPLPGTEFSNPLAAGRSRRLPGNREGKDVFWQVTSAGGEEHFLVI